MLSILRWISSIKQQHIFLLLDILMSDKNLHRYFTFESKCQLPRFSKKQHIITCLGRHFCNPIPSNDKWRNLLCAISLKYFSLIVMNNVLNMRAIQLVSGEEESDSRGLDCWDEDLLVDWLCNCYFTIGVAHLWLVYFPNNLPWLSLLGYFLSLMHDVSLERLIWFRKQFCLTNLFLGFLWICQI